MRTFYAPHRCNQVITAEEDIVYAHTRDVDEECLTT